MKQIFTRIAILLLVAALSACQDDGAVVVPTSMTAASPQTQTGTAGQPVATAPAVLLLDANGDAAPGVRVTWSIVAGEGTPGNSSSTSNADGIATLANWVLGTVAAVNRVRATTASLPAVDFEVAADAGAATFLMAGVGNNQMALTGQVLPIDPTVRVLDQYGNGRANVTVTFNITAGGGLLTDATQTTASDGSATLGSWRLGATPGENRVAVSSPGLTSVQFVAQSLLSPKCSVLEPYVPFASVNAALTDDDCLLPNEFYHDFFQVNLASSQSILFTQTSVVIDPYLLIADAIGNVLAENDGTAFGTTTAQILMIAAPGSIQLAPSSALTYELGAYSLTSAVGGEATQCERVFAMRGIVSNQHLLASDCVIETPEGSYFADDITIRLIKDVPVTINMNSAEFDTYLELYALGGLVALAVNDDADETTTDSRLTFTPNDTAYYVISASSLLQEETGAYTLSIEPAAGAGPQVGAAASGVRLFELLRRNPFRGEGAPPSHIRRVRWPPVGGAPITQAPLLHR